MRKISFLIFFVVCLILITAPAYGQSFEISKGQIVYVPAVHGYLYGNEWMARTVLIIRNVDLNRRITVNSVELYGPDGNKVDYEFLAEPEELDPLESIAFLIPPPPYVEFWGPDAAIEPGIPKEGRPGFIVRWTAAKPVNTPIINSSAVIVYQEGGLGVGLPNFSGLTFQSARVLKELR